MSNKYKELTSTDARTASDAEAIRHLQQSISSGKNWFVALLEAMGLWTSTEETYRGRAYRYVIAGEAFDWLLLAERLCQAVDSLLPESEKNALVFQGKPPLSLSSADVKKLIGQSKYCQYLNYFYGITIEGLLALAVQEEVQKERPALMSIKEADVIEEAFVRIYGTGRISLLEAFRNQKHYPKSRSMTLDEIKEFNYWLFKYRIRHCEKAKVASDTKKALSYLKRQWANRGLFAALAIDDSCPPENFRP